MALNLTHLGAFHAVAETGSISRGAERLLVSQPAVSKQIRLLERSLSHLLFDRHPKGVLLTDAGQTLAEYARRIFTAADDAEIALRDLASGNHGKLAIAASTTIGTYLLPEVFVAFRQRFPGVRTTMEVASSAAVARRVAVGDFDVGFMETFCDTVGTDIAPQGFDELVGIVSTRHPLAVKGRATAQRFCQEPFVVRETGSETKSFAERILSEKGQAIRPVMALGSTEAIKRAVAAGIGVAIVSRLSIDLELKAKHLAIVQLSDLRIRRPLYRVTRSNRQVSSALEGFLKTMPRPNQTSSAASSAKRGFRSK